MTFFAELRRRNVIRMAGLYLVGAWLLIQVAETLLPAFDVPGWVLRAIIIVLALGFLPALVFSWVYELTPEGLKRDVEVDPARSIAPQTAQRMDQLTLAGVLLLLLVIAADRFWPRSAAPDETPVVTSTTSVPAETAVQEAPEVNTRSIAVLPFVNMSADPEQEYFSDGLSEEILNLLAQIRELKVSGRTSSFSFKGKDTPIPEIGQLLGVAHVLEGSVRKSGDRLRITAQLIETDSGFHLWSETFDREMQDIFVIQTEIAGAIAQALKMSLLGPDQAAPVAQTAASLPAYDLFLQARRLIQGRTRSGLETARKLLDQALILDPDYAPALVAKAQAVQLLNDSPSGYGNIPLDQAVAIAQPLLVRALALDPDLAEAHALQGLLYMRQRDLASAELALERALALNPNLADALHWQALLLGEAGRLRESLAIRLRLAEIDPLNIPNLSNLPGALRIRGQTTEAEAAAVRLQRAFPDNPRGFEAQAWVLVSTGRLAAAQVPAARALALAPESAPDRTLNGFLHYALGDFERVLSLRAHQVRGLAQIALGRADEAVAEARERSAAAPADRNAAKDLLIALSLSGRHDEVLALYRERWVDLKGLDAHFGAAYFGPNGHSPLATIAAALRAQGEQQALAETLAHWHERLEFLREQGHAGFEFQTTEARYLALAGERAAALTALTAAIDLGARDPLLGQDPAFADLHDDPAFQAQISRMIELINIERARLDMAPLP